MILNIAHLVKNAFQYNEQYSLFENTAMNILEVLLPSVMFDTFRCERSFINPTKRKQKCINKVRERHFKIQYERFIWKYVFSLSIISLFYYF